MKGFKKNFLALPLIALGITVLSSQSNVFCNQTNEALSSKVSKVEEHLKTETPAALKDIKMYSSEKLESLRYCVIFYTGEPEGMYAGVSKKGDKNYKLTCDSEIDMFDLKSNGYGTVDIIIIDGKKVKSPTEYETNCANKIYRLLINEYEDRVISQNKDDGHLKQVGQELESLIENLKNYKSNLR